MPGTLPGITVASPSHDEPDYFYHWIRDAGLVYDAITEMYESAEGGQEDSNWFRVLDEWVRLERWLQRQETPSARIFPPPEGNKFGEPKFYVDGRAYNRSWARPQNDGPAIRAITAIRFARVYLSKGGNEEYITHHLYRSELPATSLIKLDLQYTATHYRHSHYDLWEEVHAQQHFYSLLLQRRALLDGAAFADERGDTGAARFYEYIAGEIAERLRAHWEGGMPYPVAHVGQDGGKADKTSNLDVSVILGSLHSKSERDGYFGVTSDAVQKAAHVFAREMSRLYRINRLDPDLPPAIGRYPEDTYDGVGQSRGNPWFLCTLAFAQVHYAMVTQYTTARLIRTTPDNVAFLSQFSAVTPGCTLTPHDAGFHIILRGLFNTADGFMLRVMSHAVPEGTLTEQFNGDTGEQQGARDLSWGYAAFITASKAREDAETALGDTGPIILAVLRKGSPVAESVG